MSGKWLLDTNVLVYYFDGVFPDNDREIDLLFNDSFYISIISKIEFLGWIGFKEPELYEQAREFIDQASVFYIDDAIADETIKIRREKKIKTPDAIIAATALVNGLGLVTADIDDFKNLALELINPFE